MTVLFAGTELDSFLYNGTPSVTTTAGYYNSNYVRHAVNFSGGSIATSPAWAAATDTWLHFEARVNGTNASTARVEMLDASNQGVARLALISDVLTVQYYNGSSWVSVGTLTYTTGTLHRYDVQLDRSVSGFIRVYMDDYLALEVPGDYSALEPVVKVGIFNRSTNGLYISQVVAADEPTIGFRLAYRQPTGDGNYTAWDGTWDEVDGAVPASDSFIDSTTDGQRESFVRAAFTVPNGYRVKAVGATARARRGGTGPSDLSLMLRFGSTDYDSTPVPLELGFNPVQAFWHVNPATLLEWTPADAGSATVEFGVKAVA